MSEVDIAALSANFVRERSLRKAAEARVRAAEARVKTAAKLK